MGGRIGLALLMVPLLVILAGCGTLAPQPDMSVAQLKAAAADKNASVVCSTIMGPWGTGKVVIVNLDQRVIDTGGVTVDANCLIGITTTKAAPVPRPIPAPVTLPSVPMPQ